MGLAIASRPEGPYTRHPANPVLDSGHEVCVWPHGRGMGCIVAPCGPQGATLQYSEDGIRFRRVCTVAPPRAPGPYREDRWRAGRGPGITWGLCQNTASPWPYLQRFDADCGAANALWRDGTAMWPAARPPPPTGGDRHGHCAPGGSHGS